ncbi:MAG TPA: sugar phosphate nucleotidyltransferase [Oligoflexia bacterium]|nr:sugar phosphate nucleotidyltransferase [Oligoflexia bacterium]HMP26904.1 sugar phosphate nucleotidyltransferase [Oligoflexia bacterium]
MSKIRSVILAGGRGTRMRVDLPKVLVSTLEKPLLAHAIDTLMGVDIDKIILVVSYKAELVVKFINQNVAPLKTPIFFAKQEQPLGTGDALKAAWNFDRSFSGTFLVTSGDVPLTKPQTIKNLLELHKGSSNTISFVSFRYGEEEVATSPYGRIKRDSFGKVVKIIEKKDCLPEELGIAEQNGGIYVIESSFLELGFYHLNNNNAQNEYYLTDLVEIAINNNLKVEAYDIASRREILGVNTQEELAVINQILENENIRERDLSQRN